MEEAELAKERGRYGPMESSVEYITNAIPIISSSG